MKLKQADHTIRISFKFSRGAPFINPPRHIILQDSDESFLEEKGGARQRTVKQSPPIWVPPSLDKVTGRNATENSFTIKVWSIETLSQFGQFCWVIPLRILSSEGKSRFEIQQNAEICDKENLQRKWNIQRSKPRNSISLHLKETSSYLKAINCLSFRSGYWFCDLHNS